jgi:hypothetical protein
MIFLPERDSAFKWVGLILPLAAFRYHLQLTQVILASEEGFLVLKMILLM